jgi:hypothetical protein
MADTTIQIRDQLTRAIKILKLTDNGDSTYSLAALINSGVSVAAASVTFTRPANATPYSAKDAIGVSLAVTGATNATPIVITCATHGLADGDPVTIASVGGNTNANGNYYAKVTGYSTVTFGVYTDKALTTPKAGNSNYTSGGTVARLFRLVNLFRTNGGSGYITKIRVITNTVAFLDPLKIHFYCSPITAFLDHEVFTLLNANASCRLGACALPALATEGTGSDSSACVGTPGDGQSNLPLFVNNGDSTRDLYFRLETTGTGTPGNGGSIFVEVTLDGN